MQDRQPMFPGRVRMLPVAGQENVFDMVMADEPTEEGTAPIKKNLLTDLTASLYGLPDPTVNDLLGVLSGAAMVKSEPKYTKITYSMQTAQAGDTIVLWLDGAPVKFVVVKTNYQGSGAVIVMRHTIDTSTAPYSAWGSGTNEYNNNTVDILANNFPTKLRQHIQDMLVSVSVPYTTGSGTLATLNRRSFMPSLTECGTSIAGANVEGEAFSVMPLRYSNIWTRSRRTSNTTEAWTYTNNNVASAATIANASYALGAACLAFSGSAVVEYYTDGANYYETQAYTYSAATILGNIIGGFTRIETGEYTGTGTYGAGNPNVLTFGFEPKIVIIVMNGGGAGSGGNLFVRGQATAQWFGNASGGLYIALSWVGNILTWYAHTQNINGTGQLNTSGTTYYYIAIG